MAAASLRRGTKHDFRLYDDDVVVGDDEGAARALCTMVAGSIHSMPCHATVGRGDGALICRAEAKASLAAAPLRSNRTQHDSVKFFKYLFDATFCNIFGFWTLQDI